MLQSSEIESSENQDGFVAYLLSMITSWCSLRTTSVENCILSKPLDCNLSEKWQLTRIKYQISKFNVNVSHHFLQYFKSWEATLLSIPEVMSIAVLQLQTVEEPVQTLKDHERWIIKAMANLLGAYLSSYTLENVPGDKSFILTLQMFPKAMENCLRPWKYLLFLQRTDSIPSTHIVAQNHLWLQYQEFIYLLISAGTWCTHCMVNIHTCRWSIHVHKLK